MQLINLKTDLRRNPIGLDIPKPRLSWQLDSDKRRSYQTAYRIMACGSRSSLESDKAQLWDSGKIDKSDSIHVLYEGKPLSSRQEVFWKVSVWDEEGKWSGWSEIACFEMGLLNESDWKARWISRSGEGTEPNRSIPAPLFRKEVQLEKVVAQARAYICGLGYFELSINGNKIGDDVLAPPFTSYDKTVLYQTYDVTSAFTIGANAIGVILGNGWYNNFTKDVWNFDTVQWRHHTKCLLQIHIVYVDGSKDCIVSDTTWKTSDSPIVFDGLKNGEYYDARLEKNGWCIKGYEDENWSKAILSKPPGGRFKAVRMPPIKVIGTLKAVNVMEAQPGVWVYDFGQNMSGWGRLKVEGSRGSEIVLRYAEKIDEKGCLDSSNIDVYMKSGQFQTDKYALKGNGVETWEPRFTYHGFQYVEVTGIEGVPDEETLTACIVHTDLENTGSFECSNTLLNSIQQCLRWSTLTNYHGIPTDCPHREKNGWTGDVTLSAEQVLMNFDPVLAYEKWLEDFKDAQRPSGQLPGIIPTSGWGFNWGSGPAWDSAVILIPWYIYLYRGDVTPLKEMYETMKRYTHFMTSMAQDYILDFGLGDWCPPKYQGAEPKCPTAVTDTGYYYVDVCIMAKAAQLLGDQETYVDYQSLALNIREAFRKRFINWETGSVAGDCQTSVACALYQGLVNEDEKDLLTKRLVELVEEKERHIDCGILGSKYLLHTLTELGNDQIAYDIATQESYPGWGYWIAQGATTLWEDWEGNSSRNHHMFSDIGAWFYKGLAGIQPDPERPGFKHIIFKPHFPEGLTWVKAKLHTVYGEVSCCWKLEGSRFEIDVRVPVNCEATLFLPSMVVGDLKERGIQADQCKDIVFKYGEDGGAAIYMGFGHYWLTSNL